MKDTTWLRKNKITNALSEFEVGAEAKAGSVCWASYEAAATGMGAGELAATTLGGTLRCSPSAPLLLFSLFNWLPSLFSLLLLSAEAEDSWVADSG